MFQWFWSWFSVRFWTSWGPNLAPTWAQLGQKLGTELGRIRPRKNPIPKSSSEKKTIYKFQVGKDSVPKKSDSKILGSRQESKSGAKKNFSPRISSKDSTNICLQTRTTAKQIETYWHLGSRRVPGWAYLVSRKSPVYCAWYAFGNFTGPSSRVLWWGRKWKRETPGIKIANPRMLFATLTLFSWAYVGLVRNWKAPFCPTPLLLAYFTGFASDPLAVGLCAPGFLWHLDLDSLFHFFLGCFVAIFVCASSVRELDYFKTNSLIIAILGLK